MPGAADVAGLAGTSGLADAHGAVELLGAADMLGSADVLGAVETVGSAEAPGLSSDGLPPELLLHAASPSAASARIAMNRTFRIPGTSFYG